MAISKRGDPSDKLSAYEIYCAECAYDLNIAARKLIAE